MSPTKATVRGTSAGLTALAEGTACAALAGGGGAEATPVAATGLDAPGLALGTGAGAASLQPNARQIEAKNQERT